MCSEKKPTQLVAQRMEHVKRKQTESNQQDEGNILLTKGDLYVLVVHALSPIFPRNPFFSFFHSFFFSSFSFFVYLLHTGWRVTGSVFFQSQQTGPKEAR